VNSLAVNLKLTFNETGKSTLSITGVTYNATGLGLNTLVSGTDFSANDGADTAQLTKLFAMATGNWGCQRPRLPRRTNDVP
jgi:hypothetical protein